MAGLLVSASLRFRLLVLLAAGALMVVGALGVGRTRTDVLPETSGPVVEVQTEALGLSADEVESLITVPQEKTLLAGVMGVTDVTSDSVPGLSRIDLHFAPGTDLYHARQLVQERLTQSFVLPNVAKPPQMIQPLSSSSRVMMIGLTSRRLSVIDLSVLARWTIVPRLVAVPGVANVTTFGQADRQFQVLVDPARLAEHGITLTQIIDTAGNAQLVSPLTFLRGNTPGTPGFVEGPNQRVTVRDLSPFVTPQDLAGVPVSGVPGRPVTLGSVATVVQGHQPLIGSALVHGQPGLVLVVQKLPSASTTAVTSGVQKALGELRPTLQGVSVDSSLFRPAAYVHDMLTNLGWALIAAAAITLLALIALFLALRPVVIGLIAIALSLLVAALVLDLLGYTFNALVALGLVTALAVIVDQAVSDGAALIASMRLDSAQPLARTVAGACARPSRAGGYALLIVLLTIVPAFIASGLTAKFVHPMLLALALAVIASMLVALTVTPALTALLFGRGSSAHGWPLARRLTGAYRRALEHAVRIPRGALLGVCAVGAAGLVALPLLSQPPQPTFKDRNIVVQWSGTPGMSLGEMQRITARAGGELAALPSVADVGADIGRAVTGDRVVNANSAELWVRIKPHANYDRALRAIRAIVQGTPGMSATVSTYEQQSMTGVLSPAPDTVTVRIYGQDYGVLGSLAAQVRAIMARTAGVRDPRVRLPTDQPTAELAINVAAAASRDVKPGDVRREAGALVSGITVGNFFQGQKVFDVVVWGLPAMRGSVDSVSNLLLDTGTGGHVRLGQVAQVRVRPDPTDIQHQADSRFIDVTGRLNGASTGTVDAAITTALRTVKFPLEYHAELLGPKPGSASSHLAIVSYMLAALLGILLLLQAALASWRDAVLLFVLLPVSLLGGVLVALATGTTGSLGAVAGLLGALALGARQLTAMGIAIRDRQTAADELRAPLVIDAATEQAGPRLAGAIVAAAALLPFVVLGDSAGGELPHVAAAVMLGGIASATALSLLVLPAALLRFGTRRPVEEIQVSDLRAPENAAEGASHARA